MKPTGPTDAVALVAIGGLVILLAMPWSGAETHGMARTAILVIVGYYFGRRENK